MVATVDRLLAWLDAVYASVSRNAAFWALFLVQAFLLCVGVAALAIVISSW